MSAAALLLILALPVPSVADDAAGRARRALSTSSTPSTRTQDATVDPLVRKQLVRTGFADVLVTLASGAALVSARVTSAGDSRDLLRATVPAYRRVKDEVRARVPGLEIVRNYRTLPVVFARVGSEAELRRLASDPAVIGIGADRQDEASLRQSLSLINQPAAASAGYTGADTAVAVLDTGVDYTRAAFGSCPAPGPGCKVVFAQDFAREDGMRDDPGTGRHGTNVSGIVVRVAPDTKILALDVFDGPGSRRSDQISAIDFAIANQAAYNISAINLSLGAPRDYHASPCSNPSDGRIAAFANARAAGILPVVASGNDAFSGGTFQVGIATPACIPGALPVGAVYDSDSALSMCPGVHVDEITCFSQSWARPMVLAPGSTIRAAGLSMEGTSQAAPHIAGAVAVIQDAADVSATASQVETALLNVGPLIHDALTDMDYHRLDLPAAIAALGVTPTPNDCTITGTSADDVLEGTPGDDVYCGEGGGDIIVLSGGSDAVDGGGGFDFVSLEDAGGGGTVDLIAGTAAAAGIDASLEGVEGVIGSPFNDLLVGGSGKNEFLGSGGDDSIDGRGGFDLARYDFASGRVRANLAVGSATGDGADDLDNVEGIVGGTGNDVLRGNGKANTLYGLKGRDELHGGGKPDLLLGGANGDELFGDGGSDTLNGGPGPDACDPGRSGASLTSC